MPKHALQRLNCMSLATNFQFRTDLHPDTSYMPTKQNYAHQYKV